MDKVWEILKRETPTRVDEINLALQTCIDTIENTRALLQDKSIKYMNLEKSQEAIELIRVREKLLDVKSYIEDVKCGDIFVPQNTGEVLTEDTAVSTEELESLCMVWTFVFCLYSRINRRTRVR